MFITNTSVVLLKQGSQLTVLYKMVWIDCRTNHEKFPFQK